MTWPTRVVARPLSVGRFQATERPEGCQCAGPRPEVLGREVAARRIAQIGVDVIGRHPLDVPVGVHALEQLLARQLLAAANDASEAPIAQAHLDQPARLAPEAEPDPVALDAGVAVAEGGQPEGAVEPRVGLVADPDQGQFEQADDGGQDLVARQSGSGQVGVAPLADHGQRGREFEHPPELVEIAAAAPVGVIAVLLPAAGVAAGGLDVARRERADPYVGPCRRHGHALDPGQLDAVANALSVGVAIREAATGPASGDPRARVRGVPKTCLPRRQACLGCLGRFGRRTRSLAGGGRHLPGHLPGRWLDPRAGSGLAAP